MKLRIAALLVVMVFSSLYCQQQKEITKEDLKNDVDSSSYAIGYDIGSNFSKQNIEVNYAALTQGINHGLGNGKAILTEKEVASVLQAFSQKMMQKQMADKEAESSANKEEGKTFLEENKKKDGVKVTESGLQYKELKSGNGPKPKETDKVKVHYTGRFINGEVFDSSVERGQPAEFNVNGVIKGWTEALQMMNVGDKWELYIPSELAYGERGAGNTIPPGTTLIFEVELLSIE